MTGWQVNDHELEVSGGKQSWPNFRILSRYSPVGTQENQNISISIAGAGGEIWTLVLPNTKEC
jgi:hypothetical protein